MFIVLMNKTHFPYFEKNKRFMISPCCDYESPLPHQLLNAWTNLYETCLFHYITILSEESIWIWHCYATESHTGKGKVPVFNLAVNHYTKKIYGEWRYRSSILDLCIRWRWSASRPSCQLDKRLQSVLFEPVFRCHSTTTLLVVITSIYL
jgi:hypothetical protein